MADTSQARESRHYFISGMVQGVGYRYFAMRSAQRLGLGGYARNLPDGRVEVYAVGSASKLADFRAELERGPQGASVASVAEVEASLNVQFERGFSIEH
jgi:acylphosphatase